MGFYGLLPADKLSAQYDVAKQLLILTGSGKHAQVTTSAIGFTQQPWFGGLKFEFGGWTGPLVSPAEYFNYTRASNFPMQLPNPVTPSNTVIIVTSNHPNGTVLDIEFIPAQGASPTYTSSATISSEAIKIQTSYGTPFKLYAQLQASTIAKELVSIKFDDTVLALKNSGVKDGKLEWTLEAIQHTVTTNVNVYVSTSPSVAPVVTEYVITVGE